MLLIQVWLRCKGSKWAMRLPALSALSAAEPMS